MWYRTLVTVVNINLERMPMRRTTDRFEASELGLRILHSRDTTSRAGVRKRVAPSSVCDNVMVQDLIDEAVVVLKQELRRIGVILGFMILLMAAVLFRVHL